MEEIILLGKKTKPHTRLWESRRWPFVATIVRVDADLGHEYLGELRYTNEISRVQGGSLQSVAVQVDLKAREIWSETEWFFSSKEDQEAAVQEQRKQELLAQARGFCGSFRKHQHGPCPQCGSTNAPKVHFGTNFGTGEAFDVCQDCGYSTREKYQVLGVGPNFVATPVA